MTKEPIKPIRSQNLLTMLIAKHLYLAESALSRLDEIEHDKQLREVDRLRKELKKYEKRVFIS